MRYSKALNLTCRCNQVTPIVAFALTFASRGGFPVIGFEMLSYLFLEHLRQDGLDAFADSGVDDSFDVMLELFSGQVPFS